MPETICICRDDKGPCKQVGIYDNGRFCGYHWARIDKTVLNASQGFDTVTLRSDPKPYAPYTP